MSKAISKQRAVELLWEMGKLEYKLNPGQKEIYDLINNTDKKIIPVAISRRWGKTTLLCLISLEKCLRTPNSTVIFICPTKAQIMEILKGIMVDLLLDCPEHLKPTFKRNDGMFVFHNGSKIRLAGVDDGHHESLRGAKADLCVVDEAGFCDDLQYVVQSVLLPTTSTTRGRVVLISTPSRSPDHAFVSLYMKKAREDGHLIIKTIWDNPNIPDDEKQLTIDAYPGGVDNPEFKREYLCITNADAEYSVVPEFVDAESNCVMEIEKPEYFDSYTSMDPGGSDYTGLLFAYFDFKNNQVVIEDELFIPGTKHTTDELATFIEQKEDTAFLNPTMEVSLPAFIRVSDNNNLTLLHDLTVKYGLNFLTTRKDNKHAAVNTVRTMFSENRIRINPRCTQLISQLKGCTWNKSRKDFERSKTGSHYDLVSALIYLIRNIDFTKNPYPSHHSYRGMDFIRDAVTGGKNDLRTGLKNIFKLGSKK